MSSLLANLGSVVSTVTGFIGDIATAVTGQPLLLIGVGVGLLGAGVGLVKRFM